MVNKPEDHYFSNGNPIEYSVAEICDTKTFFVNYFCCICYQPAPVLENGTSFCESHAKEHDHGRGKTLCQMADEFKKAN